VSISIFILFGVVPILDFLPMDKKEREIFIEADVDAREARVKTFPAFCCTQLSHARFLPSTLYYYNYNSDSSSSPCSYFLFLIHSGERWFSLFLIYILNFSYYYSILFIFLSFFSPCLYFCDRNILHFRFEISLIVCNSYRFLTLFLKFWICLANISKWFLTPRFCFSFNGERKLEVLNLVN
jgi:hypothetical protein